MRFYVYLICDPRPGKNNVERYVGKGQRTRAKQHLNVNDARCHNRQLRGMIAQSRKLDLAIKSEIIARFNVEADAFAFEIALIKKYGRRNIGTGSLYNLTDGGEGMSGWVPPQAHVERMRQRNTDPDFAKKRLDALRETQADPEFIKAHTERGRNNMTKLNANPKFREAASERLRRQRVDPTFEKAMIESLPKRGTSWAEAISLSRKKRIRTDPAFAKAVSEHMTKLNADPGFRARANAASKPITSALMRKANSDPEFQIRRRAGLAAYWAKRRAET
jgi:hypothetical protein